MEKLIQLLIFLNFAVSNTAYGKSGEMFSFVLPLRFSAYPFVKPSQTFMDTTKSIDLIALMDRFL